MPSKLFSHKDYSVGWICALPKERAAAHAMLDSEHEPLSQPDHDHNTYTLGSIGGHNIVIACLPSGEIGNNAAANIVTQMINTFPSIKFGLMVGIGGGIPARVRLGDIVVSRPSGSFPGVVQWDLGKSEKLGFKRTGALDRPPRILLTALAKLEASHDMHDSQISNYLRDMANNYPKLVGKYTWSPRLKDPMLEPDISEANASLWGSVFVLIFQILLALYRLLSGLQKPVEKIMPSMSDEKSIYGEPRDIGIHYGLIASGNQVVKDRIIRDRINQSLGGEVLCIEMEAAGLMNNFPCIIIRGICDYADEKKNKDWQEYAAALAAGFTKELLQHVRSADVDSERPVKDILQKVEEGVLHIEQLMDKSEVTKIVDWLTTANYGQQHDKHSETHKKGTSLWILETDEFQNWLNNSKQRLLCQGMPGAGKTIMTSVVVDHLTKTFKGDSDIGMAYIYCTFKQPKSEHTTRSLLSSVLKQLAGGRETFPATTRSLYEQHEAKQTHASQEELIADLKAVIELYSSVFIIIDALDECDLNAMHGFIYDLFMLQKHCSVNIFATSRFIPEITEWFTQVGSSFLEIRARASDIATYLDIEMKESSTSLIKSNINLQEDIKREICEAADGMFLLAQLYLELLRDKINVKEIRQELQAFRTDARGRSEDEKTKALTHAYDKAIERINEQSLQMKRLAMKVLLWVTFAKRALTTSELQHALGTKQGMTTIDDEDLSNLGDMGRVCVGLVTVDEKSGIIQLVHYTTQEYFENTQSRWFPEADSVLLGACITYLSFKDFESGFCTTDDEFEQREAQFPLCNYAASYWGDHASKNEQPGEEILEFLMHPAKVDASVQAQLAVKHYSSHEGYSQDVPRRVTALHLAARFGLTELTRVLLEQHKCNPNSCDSNGQSPLLWATRNGHEDVIELMIEANADLEVRDKEEGATPLIWAARKGYKNVVNLLLERGGEINAKDNRGRTPLSLAALHKHESIMQLLFNKGGIVDADDEKGKVKLLANTQVERQAALKMLNEHYFNSTSAEQAAINEAMILHANETWSGVATQELRMDDSNLDEMDEHGRTRLSRAAESGDKEIVQMLLATGKADINGRDGEHKETPLIWAAKNGHKAIVELLLDAGADINAKEQKLGETALTLAMEGGHETTVQALLDKGADVHQRDFSGHTPLFTTTWQNGGTMMKLLLDRGVDVHARNEDEQTPMFSTCAYGSVELVKLLLDAGADIDAVDKKGVTPLFFATALHQKDIISLLLERGSDINARDEDGRTAIYTAIGSGDKDVVNLLLSTNTVDIYNKDENGMTPIDWAKDRGNRDIVHLLHHHIGASQAE
ncbi:ankyrin repeat-containing domain protein [Trichoderma sp. SZMC 28015]